MTTVDSAASASTTGVTQAAKGGSTTTGLSDYDDFLSLLTTQLKNQDPLNPQDSTAFVEQIATFTGVEQQLNTNAKLDQLIAAQTSNSLSDLAQWVGRDVVADGVMIDFSGDDVTLTAPDSGGAQSAAIVIKDKNGSEVARLNVDPAGGSVVWNGSNAEGDKVDTGLYQIEYAFTTNTSNGPKIRTETPKSVGTVVEARLNADGETELVLEGGLVVVKPSAVTSVLSAKVTSPDDVLDDAADAAEAVADAAEEVAETVAETTSES